MAPHQVVHLDVGVEEGWCALHVKHVLDVKHGVEITDTTTETAASATTDLDDSELVIK